MMINPRSAPKAFQKVGYRKRRPCIYWRRWEIVDRFVPSLERLMAGRYGHHFEDPRYRKLIANVGLTADERSDTYDEYCSTFEEIVQSALAREMIERGVA